MAERTAPCNVTLWLCHPVRLLTVSPPDRSDAGVNDRQHGVELLTFHRGSSAVFVRRLAALATDRKKESVSSSFSFSVVCPTGETMVPGNGSCLLLRGVVLVVVVRGL
ncbi:unnamed protein product [Soboliphyme baturini]|uniref:Secreted protein n=1 Tax=Soboliphyme baturini TaxID=241478 RepID=A0A183IXK6_9BILA|nr:unnamed protein product [Soboliphyme baturini]